MAKARTRGPDFSKWQRELFNTILEEEGLRLDREGRPRTAYSLRHTYICLRLMEGADIYQIAKNCRTSVDDRKILCCAHQNQAGCCRDQRHATAQVQKQNRKEISYEIPSFTSDFGSPSAKLRQLCCRETGDVELLEVGRPLEVAAKPRET